MASKLLSPSHCKLMKHLHYSWGKSWQRFIDQTDEKYLCLLVCHLQFIITPIVSAEGLCDRSPIPASLIWWSKLRPRPALLRNTLNDWHANAQNWRYYFESVPPIPSAISFVRRNAGGRGLGSRPKIKPKSIWKKCPVGCIMLSRCRSPTPSRYVRTQYPAQRMSVTHLALHRVWCSLL
jgi:hypothetical protein